MEELAAAWADLDSLEGAKGDPAVRTLVAGGPDGVRAVVAGIESTVAHRRMLAASVEGLASEDPAARAAATKALLAGGFPALIAAKDAAFRAMPEEVRGRAGEIVKQFAAKGVAIPLHGMVGDNLRLIRAVHVLETIGGADARAQIERIAAIAGKGDKARSDALAALERMRK